MNRGFSEAFSNLSRRAWLRLGLGVPAFADSMIPTTDLSPGFGKARSVVVIYTSGGQSQLDTWDPKPLAPELVRGEFDSIPTAIPGVRFCEHLPKLACQADQFALIRSMSHEDLDHGSATYLTLTGQYHARKSSNPPSRPEDLPTAGAIWDRLRPSPVHPYGAVTLNGPALVPMLPAPGQGAGLLGRRHDPLVVSDPQENPFILPEIPQVRTRHRLSLLESIDATRQDLAELERVQELNQNYRQALKFLDSASSREAFDLNQESDELRDRYGRYQAGQACLLARRLVEAGVPWITVVWCRSNRGQDEKPEETEAYGWDCHNDIFSSLKNHLLPRFDQTLSTMLEDFAARGLLEKTLIVCMGEFGRAPLVALEKNFAGNAPGRKHWASVYSIALCGGGVQKGLILGESDRNGAYPASEPFGPWDVTATLFHSLGLDPSTHYHDPANRPYAISVGKPIQQLFG